VKRTWITLILVAAALGIVIAAGSRLVGPEAPEFGEPEPAAEAPAPAPADAMEAEAPDGQVDGLTARELARQPGPDGAADRPTPGAEAAPSPEEPEAPEPRQPADATEPGEAADAIEADEPAEVPADLGPLVLREHPEPYSEAYVAEHFVAGSAEDSEANPYHLRFQISPWGAGVQEIDLARYSTRALEHIPYPIQRSNADRYPLASLNLYINGERVLTGVGDGYPIGAARWRYDEAASTETRKVFDITVVEADGGEPVLRVRRTFELDEDSYDVRLRQRIENLAGAALEVQLEQLGPVDVPREGGYMGDRRGVILGYFQPQYDPRRQHVFVEDHQYYREDVIGDPERATLWPSEAAIESAYELVYAAMVNRYFTTVVHAPTQPAGTGGDERQAVALSRDFPQVERLVTRAPGGAGDPQHLSLMMRSRVLGLGPAGSAGAAADLDVAMFAGPKSPAVIEAHPVYTALGLDKLIIYNIGGCCSFLTFAWLAEGLLAFLTLLHAGLLDWGLAIIVLVIVVRAILHPITKKSQVNMQKFGKQMQTMQPEMERLKKKYKDNTQKLNQEMMKLYREKGVNPAAMGLGCLPMFLQMPIWIALYAMLYFAIELRHEPAFYDVFHRVGEALGVQWHFLTDLSRPDSFIPLGPASFTIPFTPWRIEAVNILPILMGLTFFFQQKFMQPPQTQPLSEQQIAQQRMMKIMPLIFPIFLYKAPAGLTLYILASTAAGILDSYLVRRHIKREEEAGTLFQKKEPKPGGLMDKMQKAAEAKRQEMEQRQRELEKRGGGSGKPAGKGGGSGGRRRRKR